MKYFLILLIWLLTLIAFAEDKVIVLPEDRIAGLPEHIKVSAVGKTVKKLNEFGATLVVETKVHKYRMPKKGEPVEKYVAYGWTTSSEQALDDYKRIVAARKGSFIDGDVKMESDPHSLYPRKMLEQYKVPESTWTLISTGSSGEESFTFPKVKEVQGRWKDDKNTYIERVWEIGHVVNPDIGKHMPTPRKVYVTGSFLNTRPEDEDLVREAVMRASVTVLDPLPEIRRM